MPNKWTFKQNKLLNFILKYLPENRNVLIPFAGQYRFTKYESKGCTFTYNDINVDMEAGYHVEAWRLRKILHEESFGCIIADPPYTHYQGTKSYSGFKVQRITDWRKTANYLLKPNGIYIELGYNSTGLRQEIAEKIALGICCLGGSHNDILIVVQKKYNDKKQGDNLLL